MALARSMKLIYSISLILILVLSTLSIPGSDANSMWHQSTSDDFRDGSFNNLTLTNKGVEVELRLRDIPLNWTEVKPKPNPNSFANVAMDTIWGTDEVLLYNSGSTWIFNLSTNKWTNKNPPTNPGTLIYFTMASIYGTDKVVIFGGAKTGFFNSLNKTWAYDRSDNNWTWINTTKTPPARSLTRCR